MHHTRRSFLALIGVHRGQFPDTIQIRLTKTGELYEAEIPSSMTVVVPAWEISTLLNSSRLEAQANARDKLPDRIQLSEKICALQREQGRH